MYPQLIQVTDIGHVRQQLEVLARLRLKTGLAVSEQARYQALCVWERRLLTTPQSHVSRPLGYSLGLGGAGRCALFRR
jgi:hypothetical protein